MDKLPVDLGTAERFLLGTDEMTVLATSEDTNGALFAHEVRMHPGGGPPMMHRHDPGEIYVVREGVFTFYVGEGEDVRRVHAGPGDVVPLAGGTPHTIRNESDEDAVAIVVHAPGEPMEHFSRAVADLVSPDIDAVLALAELHGIEMLGPIPSVA